MLRAEKAEEDEAPRTWSREKRNPNSKIQGLKPQSEGSDTTFLPPTPTKRQMTTNRGNGGENNESIHHAC
ncbi:unnamed protein product [Linum trigynum]|uniref:Uncharacterized protein n=1 Tax=Linum trigynum TaxID=586398 RepID=A0AAV2FLZ0_9ROSI